MVPVIAGIRERSPAPLSVDTRKAAVARAALAAGADLVNDVSAGRFDPAMPAAVAEAGAGAILMHMKGTDPRTMQDDLAYAHPLGRHRRVPRRGGRPRRSRPASPPRRSRSIRASASARAPERQPPPAAPPRRRCATLGFPVAVGASRKAFVRRFSGVADDAGPADRLPGSLAALAAAARGGGRDPARARRRRVGPLPAACPGHRRRRHAAGGAGRSRRPVIQSLARASRPRAPELRLARRPRHPDRRGHHLRPAAPDPRARAPSRWCSGSSRSSSSTSSRASSSSSPLTTVLKALIFYVPFAIIVLFSHELRRALAAFGRTPFFALFSGYHAEETVSEIVLAVTSLSARRVGALIVLERREGLKTYIENGSPDRLGRLLRAARHALRAGHAPARRRGHRLGRPDRGRRELPAPLAQGGPAEALRHAPPRGDRHHRGDRRRSRSSSPRSAARSRSRAAASSRRTWTPSPCATCSSANSRRTSRPTHAAVAHPLPQPRHQAAGARDRVRDLVRPVRASGASASRSAATASRSRS